MFGCCALTLELGGIQPGGGGGGSGIGIGSSDTPIAPRDQSTNDIG